MCHSLMNNFAGSAEDMNPSNQYDNICVWNLHMSQAGESNMIQEWTRMNKSPLSVKK